MLQIRKSEERGHAEHGWLDSHHSFSFANYYDPAHTHFGPLLVINEDRVAPGMGFGTHGHRDMEIISYVLQGELAHRDSMGNGSVLKAGDVQRMRAGTGVQHSEFNHSQSEPVHFLQIWIRPSQQGLAPGYAERHFTEAEKRGRLCPIATPDGREQSLQIHQDALLFASLLDGEDQVHHALDKGRCAYVQLVRGSAQVNGQTLAAGDALKLRNEPGIEISKAQQAELLVFDLPDREA